MRERSIKEKSEASRTGLGEILFRKAAARLNTSKLTHTPAKLPDVYLVDGKHIRNLARVFNTLASNLRKREVVDEPDLGGVIEVVLEILEGAGVDRENFGDLEVLE